MLRSILKWTFLTLGGLFILVLLFYAIVYFNTQARINKVYAVRLQTLSIPHDSASYQRGHHLAINRGCLGCHGSNLGGGEAFPGENTPIGLIYSANLTSGRGGIHFKDEDWIRVLRHGLDQQNKSVWFMPSHEIYHISNQDLGDLICFLKQQPPVDKTMPAKSIKPLGRLLTFFNKFPLLPAEMIDHNAIYKDTVQVAATAEYGRYLVTTCKGCHGENLKGGPARSKTTPPIPNITSTGDLGKWNVGNFMAVLHTGNTPEGRHLSDAMPWKYFSFSDAELTAIYLYLHQLK